MKKEDKVGKVLSMETGEMGRCREISRMILDAEEFVYEAMGEVQRLELEFSRLKEDIAFLEMKEDVCRGVEFGGMTAHDARRGLRLTR